MINVKKVLMCVSIILLAGSNVNVFADDELPEPIEIKPEQSQAENNQ